MNPDDGIPIDGIALGDGVVDIHADDMGIPFAAEDAAPAAGASAAYAIDLDSGSSGGRISDDPAHPANIQERRRIPPVLRAIATIYQRNATGTLNISDGEAVFMSMFIKDGRILNVAHQDLARESLGALLLDSGLITARRLKKAIVNSKAAGTTLDSYLAASRIVSGVTLQHLVEGRCGELVLSAMADDGVKVSFSRRSHEGLRKNCQIPLPWLLKEYRRRESELPVILAAIPDSTAAFVRTSLLESEPIDELWEELDMGASEKQVYFFVDGTRTIKDLVLATGQSRFAVMRALAGLIRGGDVVATLEPAKRRRPRHGLRSSSRALTTMLVLFLLLGGMGVAVLRGHYPSIDETTGIGSAAWGDLFQTAAADRVAGAKLSYQLIADDNVPAPDKLLEYRLILPGDINSAVSLFRSASPEGENNEPEQGIDTVGH